MVQSYSDSFALHKVNAAEKAPAGVDYRRITDVYILPSVFLPFFCRELDSSANGSHDGFIRGLQP